MPNCPICKKKLTQQSSVHRHMRTVHKIEPFPNGYSCPHCGKTFPTHHALNGHLVTAHRPDLQKRRALCSTPEKYQQIAEKLSHPRGNPLIRITKNQRALILGSLLGDLGISRRKPSCNPRLQILHGLKQAEYARWKYSILAPLTGTPPRISENSGWGEKVISFSSLSLPCLVEIYNLVTINRRRTITENWLNQIESPLSLAVWYMDDGTFYKGTTRLASNKFTKSENELLSRWLLKSWGVQAIVSRSRDYYYLRMNKEGSIPFLDLVTPYVKEIPSMAYKIGFMI